MRGRFLQTLSTGGRAVVHPSNGGKPIHLFPGTRTAELRTSFEGPADRSGFFGGGSSSVPYFLTIFAIANFFGPLLFGRLLDTVGRKPMIAGSYLGSAAVAVVLAVLLVNGSLTVWSLSLLISLTFFAAAAGASSAYPIVSEVRQGEWAPPDERVRHRPADVRQAVRGRDQRIADERTAARRLDHRTADVDAALARAAESLRRKPRGVRDPGARPPLLSGLDAVEHCAVGPRSLCRTFADLRLMNELRRLRASHTEDRPEARRRRDRTTLGGLLRSLRSGEPRGRWGGRIDPSRNWPFGRSGR